MASSSQSATSHDMYTEEERRAIEAQLERLLANPYFSHSRRFPSFLRYIVNATVNGQADLLKERTLGIEIFAKSAAYDPALDPIVRVTAAEIRKRIAQYYQDPGHENELRVSLPPGSYVPPGCHYQAAPMPYFMEFRKYVGMHAGYLPGYPASHGCVRMPRDLAADFFARVQVGTPVKVIGNAREVTHVRRAIPILQPGDSRSAIVSISRQRSSGRWNLGLRAGRFVSAK